MIFNVSQNKNNIYHVLVTLKFTSCATAFQYDTSHYDNTHTNMYTVYKAEEMMSGSRSYIEKYRPPISPFLWSTSPNEANSARSNLT